MQLLRVDPEKPEPGIVAQVVRLLKGGGIVAAPTDTVYGLLASVNRPDALEKLVQLKVRPVGKPFVLLAADWIGVRAVTSYLTPVARSLGAKYWPGPLTLVLPAEENLPDEVTAAGKSVAVRIPADPWLRAILQETRAALAAPSANLPGEPTPRDAASVVRIFGAELAAVLDGGHTVEERASTLVNCCGRTGQVLRDGPIVLSPDELEER